jgi:DNA-binding protein YbaB
MNRFMMRRAQELGTKLAKVQEELEEAMVEASSGGGR